MTINDGNWKFLHDITGLSLTYNGMYFRYLRNLGYTGTLQDMIGKSKKGLNPSGLKNPSNPGVVTPVTPLTIAPGATFWIDPSLLSSVTLNGGDVAQINDLTGLTHYAEQATPALQPLYATGGSGINSKSVISFTGANNDALSLANSLSLGRNMAGLSFAGVIRIPTLGVLQRLLTLLTTGSATLFAVNISTTGTLSAITRRLAADSASTLNSTAVIVAGTPAFVAVSVNYATGEVITVINGVSRSQTAAWAAGSANQDVDHPAAPNLGRFASTVLTGDEAECCFWPRVLTPTEIASLRTNYFKPKWATP